MRLKLNIREPESFGGATRLFLLSDLAWPRRRRRPRLPVPSPLARPAAARSGRAGVAAVHMATQRQRHNQFTEPPLSAPTPTWSPWRQLWLPLPERLEDHDGPRRRHVERVLDAEEWDLDHAVARGEHLRVDADELVAEHER
jgi:hypothetical protein